MSLGEFLAKKTTEAAWVELVCEKKGSFKYARHAKRSARKIAKRGGPKLKAYKCPHCGRYHLTKRRKR